jgi:predicted ATP-grasp superfamily ATP-dependent carboligase
MKVLVFEWLTGGGLFIDNHTPESSMELLKMGMSMVSAVTNDLASFADVQLVWDERLKQPNIVSTTLEKKRHRGVKLVTVDGSDAVQASLSTLADEADAILLIAPESGKRLADLIANLDKQQGKLISPSLEFAVLTSDKNLLAESMRASGFLNITEGLALNAFLQLPESEAAGYFPAVVKPFDGAGSEQVALVENHKKLNRKFLNGSSASELAAFRIEKFVQGTPVSVSVIKGSAVGSTICANSMLPLKGDQSGDHRASLILKPYRQHFDREPFGNYLESIDDLSDQQIFRAQKLAESLLPHLPDTAGYFGIDLVLSDEGPDRDVVIEVNPRLTMSYLALQKNCDFNLAQQMVIRSGLPSQ